MSFSTSVMKTNDSDQTPNLTVAAAARHSATSSFAPLRILATANACVCFLILATLIPAVIAIDFAAAFSYASNSTAQIYDGKFRVYPDPSVGAPAPAACVGDIALTERAHVYGNHTGASVSFYDVSTTEFIGSPPSYSMPVIQDLGVCVTGPLTRTEYETRCWDTIHCPNADMNCTCGSRHAEGHRVDADGFFQPDSPTAWTSALVTFNRLILAVGRAVGLA